MNKRISTKLPYSLFVFFLFVNVLCTTTAVSHNKTTPVNVNVGVVLNLETMFGKMALSCIDMALEDFYASNSDYQTRLILHTRDSKSDVVGAASAALDLIKNEQVQAILGPVTSMETNFVIGIGDKAQVPIITFSATSHVLSSIRSSYFIRATQNDRTQVKAISSIVKAFQWRQAVPIYVDNEFGDGIILNLTASLYEINVGVPYRSAISESASDDQILAELYKLMSMQTRVFIVHMLPPLAARLFAKAEEIGMMDKEYVWILTDGVTNLFNMLHELDIDHMQGALGVKTYVPRTKNLGDFRVRWKRNNLVQNPDIFDAELNVFGLWAHDAAVALAIAIEKAGTKNLTFKHGNISSNSSTDLESFGVSQNGPNLLQSLLSTSFRGLAGEFVLVDAQLQSSAFQIINVNANGERGVGFWTPKNGLVKTLKLPSSNMHSSFKDNLAPIIWPGESMSIPKGWDISTNGKVLKIGVPVKDGFTQFVKTEYDAVTNRTRVTGYCIDIFNAVMQALPYAVRYEFIPFANPDGTSAGSYNDLIDQVYYQNYDVAVGDTTIIANRSNYVDFTLPYSESGVAMVVPVEDDRRKNAWIFLKPLTWDLWLTSACFFVFIGFVVWILEHRVNEDFRGPPLHQIGTSLWFSFSTMVFAHKERVMNNLARFVVIVWCFVVLILTSSYTASLTSLLTVEQLRPRVTDVRWLVKNGEAVGYQDGSFVHEILESLGFKENKLLPYGSVEECHELFLKGTAKGGIAAAFDEVPYIRLMLAKYSSKYTMRDPRFKTAGFGFVFPRGSPLVDDVSRATLNVTEGNKMKGIENTWFGNLEEGSGPSNSVSSSSLGIESFWGLFVIAGTTAILALLIFTVMFINGQRHVWARSSSESSLWSKIVAMWRQFDNKDLTSHTFKNISPDRHERNDNENILVGRVVELSPSTNYPASPFSYSDGTDLDSANPTAEAAEE